MQEKDYQELLKKYNHGLCSEDEKALLESWYILLAEKGQAPSHDMINQAYADVRAVMPGKSHPKLILMKRLAAAVVIVLVATAAFYSVQRTEINPDQLVELKSTQPEIPGDAMPGGNRAILTLSDGSAINLDDAQQGELAKQGGTDIQKTSPGTLVYASGHSTVQIQQILYNTVATPRGGQYLVTLPDRTRVWLNAASSLKFPTAFTGDNRKVTLTGEAYFEVSEDKSKPFMVSVNNAEVEVLGTHFNIMAYADEVLTTTLLEGSVKFKHNGVEKTIVPGQAARLSGSIRVSEVNTDDAVAWKNGVTAFNNADIQSIMRQICRWYDLDVVYKGDLPERKFTGKIPRTANLSKVLKVLELSDINFNIEDKQIIVTP